MTTPEHHVQHFPAVPIVDPAIMVNIRNAAGLPDPDLIDIDSEYYTIDEIEQIETRTGKPFTQFMQGEGLKVPDLKILALMMRRRTDPGFPEHMVGTLKVRFVKKPVPPTNGNGSEPSLPLSSITG